MRWRFEKRDCGSYREEGQGTGLTTAFRRPHLSADIAAQVVAIIDIDCAVEDGFDTEDQTQLERLSEILANACDWE